MTAFVSLAAATLIAAAALLPPAPLPARAARPAAAPCRFRIVRDFTLHVDHALGAAEARRRVMARIEDLRRRFADKVSAADVVWSGDAADMRVEAFAQTATAHIAVSDDAVDVRVHLPALLAPLGGNIQAFLDKTARETLR